MPRPRGINFFGACAMKTIPVAAQMYTMRQLMETDYLEAFRQVAKLGYAGVEFGGPGPLSHKDFKKFLADIHLQAAGVHVSIDELEKDANRAADNCYEMGVRNATCPWLPENRRKNRADWLALAKSLNSIGEKLDERGITFSYHNHNFEFQKFDGQYALDLIFAHTDPRFVKAELDTYWVRHGGEDPAAYMKKFPGRVHLLHCKDLQAGPEKKFAPVGTGILNWKEIFDAAPAAGVQWYMVEQDDCYGMEPIESLRIGLENLKKMGVA